MADSTNRPDAAANHGRYLVSTNKPRQRIFVTGSEPTAVRRVTEGLRSSGISAEVVKGMSAAGGTVGDPTRCSDGHVLPPASDPQYGHAVLWAARLLGARVVMPTSHEEFAALLPMGKAFERAGLLVIAPSDETVERCSNRWTLNETVSHYAPVPEVYRSGTGQSVPAGEWMVRPLDASDERGSRRARPEELESGEGGADTMFVEHLPEGNYQVDLLRDADGTVCAKARVREGVHLLTIEPGTMADMLTRFATQAAEAIDLHGAATVMFRGDFIGLPMITDIVPGFAAMADHGADEPNLPLLALRGGLRQRKKRTGRSTGTQPALVAIAS
ncbi:MAG: hypothetical protein K0V04_21660 [Deltaproteobacteria bacterium]|nr:hypothetical protein [Deltaproteobacteria bacterium]